MVDGVATAVGGEGEKPVPAAHAALPARAHHPESMIEDKHACLQLIGRLPALSAEERSLLTKHVSAVHDERSTAIAHAASNPRPARADLNSVAALLFQAVAAVIVLRTQTSPANRDVAWYVVSGAVLLAGIGAAVASRARRTPHPRSRFLRWVLRVVGRDHYESPLDGAMLALLVAASAATRCAADAPATRADRREIVDALDLARRRLTSQRVNVTPLSWNTSGAERELHWRTAALVRAHADAAATAVGTADLDRIAESLASGLVAWAHGDTRALLADAPTATTRQRLRPALLRLSWTAVFALAAALGPHFAPAIAPFAPYLWAAAIGALITGTPAPTQAVSKLAESLLPKSGTGH